MNISPTTIATARTAPIATSTTEHPVLPSQSVTDDSSAFVEDDEDDDDETEGQELFLDGETSYAALASLASTARTNAPSAVTAPPSSPSSVRSRLKLRRLLSAPLVPTSSSFLRDTYYDEEDQEEEENHDDEQHKTNRNHRVDELDRRLSHLAGMVRSLLDEKDARKDARKDTVSDYREQHPHYQQQQHQQQQSAETKLRKAMEKRMQRFERTLMDKFKRERNALRAENKRMKKQLGAIRVQNDHFRERLDRVENDPVVPCRDGIVVMKGRGSPSTEDTEEEKHEEEEEEEEEKKEEEEEDVGVVDVVLKPKTDNNNNDEKTTAVEKSGKHHEHEDHTAFVTDDCVSAVPVPIMASSGQDHPQDRWKRDSMFIREENKIIKEQNSLLLEKCEWLCEQVLSMKDSMVLLSGEGTGSQLDWDSSYGYDWDDHSLRKGKSVRFALDESQEHYSDHSLSQHRQRYSDATAAAPAPAVVGDDGFEERRSSPPRLPSRPQLQQQQQQQQGWQEDVLQSDVFVSFLPNDFYHQ